MNEIAFFDVKNRARILIDSARVWKYIWKPTTRPDAPRYAVCGKTTDGRTLTKFVNKRHWDALDVQMSEPEIATKDVNGE